MQADMGQIIGIKVLLAVLSYVFNLDRTGWDEGIVSFLDLLANHVLQIPLFLMALMRYFTPTLDNMFVSNPSRSRGPDL